MLTDALDFQLYVEVMLADTRTQCLLPLLRDLSFVPNAMPSLRALNCEVQPKLRSFRNPSQRHPHSSLKSSRPLGAMAVFVQCAIIETSSVMESKSNGMPFACAIEKYHPCIDD